MREIDETSARNVVTMISSPIKSFLVKVTSRCNFNCDHCYYRNKADRSYLSRPEDMSLDIFTEFVERAAEYSEKHCLSDLEIVFHGGEPLIRGISFFSDALEVVEKRFGLLHRPSIGVQSNGSLLNGAIVDTFNRHNVSLSVSLDGPRTAQDRHRLFTGGQSSYDAVAQNCRDFLSNRKCSKFSGILSVVDLRNDSFKVYAALKSFNPHGINFLLPDGTHDAPPPQITSDNCRHNTDYAHWLFPIFDAWLDAEGDGIEIGFFENIIRVMIGGQSKIEGLGEQGLSYLTIETDGEIRDSDILSLVSENASRFGEGKFLSKECFEKLQESEPFQLNMARYQKSALSSECKHCEWVTICGGGLLPHRFSKMNGFLNPSIYCGNLKALFTHIKDRILEKG